MLYLKQFLVTIIVFFSIDIFWLAFIAKKLYQKHLGLLMADKANIPAALMFYIIYMIGLIYFVIGPGIKSGNLKTVIISGMIFGFVTYSTYDLTNLATLRDWPIIIAVLDIVWGSILCGAVSAISYMILR